MAATRTERATEQRGNPWPWVCLVACAVVFGWLWVRTEAAPDATAIESVSRIEAPAQETENALMTTALAPTGTATGTATRTPTPQPTVRMSINDCGTPTPGAVCVAPPRPTGTPTPYPSCLSPEPDEWCQWPTEAP